MKKRFTEAQIVGFLREADAGLPVKDLPDPGYEWRRTPSSDRCRGRLRRSTAGASPPSPRAGMSAEPGAILLVGPKTLHRFGDREVVHRGNCRLEAIGRRDRWGRPRTGQGDGQRRAADGDRRGRARPRGAGRSALRTRRADPRAGPAWTRAERVALYVNGTRVREALIHDGTTLA